jgi:hypothetical protein
MLAQALPWPLRPKASFEGFRTRARRCLSKQRSAQRGRALHEAIDIEFEVVNPSVGVCFRRGVVFAPSCALLHKLTRTSGLQSCMYEIALALSCPTGFGRPRPCPLLSLTALCSSWLAFRNICACLAWARENNKGVCAALHCARTYKTRIMLLAAPNADSGRVLDAIKYW